MAIARRASVTVSIAADTSGRFRRMLRVRRVASEVSRGRTWEKAGTSNTSSKVSALPRRRMRKAPDAKANYTDRARPGATGQPAARLRVAGTARHSAVTIAHATHSPTLRRPGPPVRCSVCPAGCRAGLMEVARRERPDPVQRPAAAAQRARQGHPARPARRHAARRPAAPPSPAASGAARPRGGRPELEAKRKKAEQEDAAKASRPMSRRRRRQTAENRKRARSDPGARSGMRMARERKGEREVLDDKIRAEEMKRARDLANADCANRAGLSPRTPLNFALLPLAVALPPRLLRIHLSARGRSPPVALAQGCPGPAHPAPPHADPPPPGDRPARASLDQQAAGRIASMTSPGGQIQFHLVDLTGARAVATSHGSRRGAQRRHTPVSARRTNESTKVLATRSKTG